MADIPRLPICMLLRYQLDRWNFIAVHPKGGGFFISRLSHTLSSLPLWRPILRFFFFPRESDGWKKKNREPKLVSEPKLGKIHTFLWFDHDFFVTVFFPPLNPEKKKRTAKLSPSFLFSGTTYTFVCDNRENKKPPPLTRLNNKFYITLLARARSLYLSFRNSTIFLN